jgi:diguanylate cyclase (GGDEF)-like protein/PAS domain S-box-containing protein
VTGESGGNRQSFDKSHFPQQADVLNIVLDHITQGMVVVGPDYRTLAFNRHFEEMFQLPPGTVEVGIDFREILKTWAEATGQDQKMLDYAIYQLDEPATFEFEFPQLINGERRWCLLTHNPLPGKGFVRTFTDITKRKALEATLVKLSREDPLTGLHNRRTILDLLEEEIQRGQRYKHPLSLLMMDIDHFKKINDQWGHPTGDEVLKSFAAECRSVMRENDKMGRFGGEEFVMVLPETGKMDAVLVAERIRRITAEMAVESKRGSALIPVTVSIGATTTTEGDDAEAVIARADEAMYDAKDAGRNRVVCH